MRIASVGQRVSFRNSGINSGALQVSPAGKQPNICMSCVSRGSRSQGPCEKVYLVPSGS